MKPRRLIPALFYSFVLGAILSVATSPQLQATAKAQATAIASQVAAIATHQESAQAKAEAGAKWALDAVVKALAGR